MLKLMRAAPLRLFLSLDVDGLYPLVFAGDCAFTLHDTKRHFQLSLNVVQWWHDAFKDTSPTCGEIRNWLIPLYPGCY